MVRINSGVCCSFLCCSCLPQLPPADATDVNGFVNTKSIRACVRACVCVVTAVSITCYVDGDFKISQAVIAIYRELFIEIPLVITCAVFCRSDRLSRHLPRSWDFRIVSRKD